MNFTDCRFTHRPWAFQTILALSIFKVAPCAAVQAAPEPTL